MRVLVPFYKPRISVALHSAAALKFLLFSIQASFEFFDLGMKPAVVLPAPDHSTGHVIYRARIWQMSLRSVPLATDVT